MNLRRIARARSAARKGQKTTLKRVNTLVQFFIGGSSSFKCRLKLLPRSIRFSSKEASEKRFPFIVSQFISNLKMIYASLPVI